MKPERAIASSSPPPPPEPDRPAGSNPVASALRALAACVEFLVAGGRRDVRTGRKKLNEAQRLIADIEGRI
jgi:hypothetical protein